MVIVNACLRDGRGGSPTAVLLSPPASPDRDVPVRAGTSHAVFVAMDGPVAVLRFVTRERELPACGHGTVAAIALLAQRSGDFPYAVSLRVSGRTFRGRAVRDGDLIEAVFEPGPVDVRPATPAETDPVGAALGARLRGSRRVAALARVEAGGAHVATLGSARMLVPVASRAAVAALRPDQARLRAACDRAGLLGCYVYSVPDAGGRLAARMFAPSIGVPEDIANANSTACLAAHLGTTIRADMGDALGTPATITASAAPLLVGGVARIIRSD